jgi:hypothetical protein
MRVILALGVVLLALGSCLVAARAGSSSRSFGPDAPLEVQAAGRGPKAVALGRQAYDAPDARRTSRGVGWSWLVAIVSLGASLAILRRAAARRPSWRVAVARAGPLLGRSPPVPA